MKPSTLIKVAKRLVIVIAVAWVLDYLVVQNLPDDYFDAGKQIELIVALLLAWRYCMPTAARRVPAE